MYKVKYTGNAKAIYDAKGMEARDKKNKEWMEKNKPKNVSNKIVYKAGTVFGGVKFPTNAEVMVDEKTHPELVEKLIAHSKNDSSPFEVKTKSKDK